LKVKSLESEKVFLIRDSDGIRAPPPESIKNPWRKATKRIGLEPAPRFHDLRHTWKSNALASGIDPEIRESIMGHWFKGKTVSERYGRIKDDQLLKAIDSMTFDHGETEILMGTGRDKVSDEKRVQNVYKGECTKKIRKWPLTYLPDFLCLFWSGRLDLNQRPLHPEITDNHNNFSRLALSLAKISSFLSISIHFEESGVTDL
jgi:hypothetical protein